MPELTPEEIRLELHQRLLEPKSATGDQGSIVNHSLPDLIRALSLLESSTGVNPVQRIYGNGAKIVPPSARGT